jgi:PLD-like domain
MPTATVRLGVAASDDRKRNATQLRAPRPRFATGTQRRIRLCPYAIDGALLRTGSSNFSTSGENAQDNDLVIIRDAGAAAIFDAHFERMWDATQRKIDFEPAIRA